MPCSAIPLAQKRARFRKLHESGCFLLPNPWDVGSAKRLEKLGFKALATTSAGSAWAQGKDDGELTRDQVLDHLRIMCSATDLPINADFEAGFGDNIEAVELSIQLAAETGIAGVSIEDFSGTALYPFAEAVERVRAARRALDRAAPDVVLVGRCEEFLREKSADLNDTIRRLIAYGQAGADCLYAPAITDIGAIREIVQAVAPKPVNVLLWGDLQVPALADAGVRRVSVGGKLARIAYSAFEDAARNFLEKGMLT
jgi:2-methylisocitrate lyase-like PEP mutase family enzyme